MQYPSLNKLYGIIASAAIVFVLAGCNGGSSNSGPAGAPGTPASSNAIDITTYSQDDWAALTLKAEITSVDMGSPTVVKPIVHFKVVDGHNVPVKGFSAFTSQAATDKFAKYQNLAFSIAKLVPGLAGSPDYWVNYIVTSAPTVAAPDTWAPGKPSAENQGNLVDHGDGTYTYTFLHDLNQAQAQVNAFVDKSPKFKADLDPTHLNYTPNLPHRLTLFVGGLARDTGIAPTDRGPNTADGSNAATPGVLIKVPANVVKDFIPATGAAVPVTQQREITSVDTCFTCHAKFEFHSGGRQDTRYCVVCHNDQRKFGSLEGSVAGTVVTPTGKLQDHAEGDFTSMVHRVHMGEELTFTGYNYAGVLFNEVTYPMDQRNCVKCHTNSPATPQGDNWKTAPSRFACGGCHDSNIWDAPTGSLAQIHPGGQQLTDATCAECHNAANISIHHIPVVPPNPNNAWLVPTASGGNNNTNATHIAAYTSNLPTGANIVTWDLKDFFLDTITSVPTFIFRFLKNGVPVVFNDPAVTTELLDGFSGGPSFYVAFNVPQDGIAQPADWNATASTYLKNIWRGDGLDMNGGALAGASRATMILNSTGVNAGYYTLTFNTVATPAVSTVVIPATATMVTGGIGYSYSLSATPPLTQIDLPAYPVIDSIVFPGTYRKTGGLAVPAPNVWKLATKVPATQAKQIARRPIVTNQKCNDCHSALGVFTTKVYHAGQRNDAPTCTYCHNVDRVAANGWGDNIKDAVHAIHGAGKRVNKYSWEVSAGYKYWTVTYPSVLNNCEACHVPGSYDFDIINGADPTTTNQVFGNLLWSTVATGTLPAAPVPVIVTGNEAVPGTYWSPFAAASGGGFVFGPGFSYNAGTGVTILGADTNLVSSAYVAACSNCHDKPDDIAHFKTNGGAFYEPRGTAFTHVEQCFLCHSAGKIADTRTVHMNFQ